MVTPNRTGVTTVLLIETVRRIILKKGKEGKTKKRQEVEVGVQEY
jgi:hypothetical protein